MTGAVECVWEVDARLGEGPIWCARRRRIFFVDIKTDRILACNLEGALRQVWQAPAAPSFIVHEQAGGFLIGTKGAIQRFSPETGRFAPLAAVEAELADNRLNDGFVDSQGRLWFGTMDNLESSPTGSLYCYGGDAVTVRDGTYICTNGPVTSPDGCTLYHVDTFGRQVHAFDLNADGTLSGKRVFIETEPGVHPDGLAIDSEGHVWVALYGGWGVRRYAPDGTLSAQVDFPCSAVTKIAFAGDDLRWAYATTANKHIPENQRAGEPLAGGLFRFRVDVPGMAPNVFRM